ncbi:DNAJ protein Spf31 [Schizosaccharomyces japonicus yFS275]|uniref:DNAJ protein Spf31 n=1 Tax=Schizosaccharomyces japonicus (strain yFS275 / FY16936) TaxID=402676 RepID=B6JWP0_SCHJY|nr:DNAJ protein Spf31 [Schizosaccharomyces japonicus yFS275]EEB05791.1 DNAJ protein Spf31 [Schizosaccharomyces japonicus yFS275]
MSDIDRLLSRLESSVNKDREIERIMGSFKLNAYDVLGVMPGISPEEIRNVYRKMSLLIHPDKNRDNPKAAEAFDVLKKAESELLDDKVRESLDSAFTTARNLVMREKKLNVNSEEVKSEEFLFQVRMKWREILIEDEVARRRARTLEQAYQRREREKEEEVIRERKMKAESERVWEETRSHRVNNWQKFLHKTKKDSLKKKSKKPKVLG